VGQEFFVKSTTLEDKVRQILPSQGGLGAGFDLSASTQIIPIVDLTESAEGSTLRQDLQTSFSLNSISAHNVANATTTIVNNTGYFRIYGVANLLASSTTAPILGFNLTDGVTTKKVLEFNQLGNPNVNNLANIYDFVVLLQAGESLTINSNSVNARARGLSRQIADLDGNLVNP